MAGTPALRQGVWSVGQAGMGGYKGRATRSDLDLFHSNGDQREADNNRGPWSENLANRHYQIYHFIHLGAQESGKRRQFVCRAVTDIIGRPDRPVNA